MTDAHRKTLAMMLTPAFDDLCERDMSAEREAVRAVLDRLRALESAFESDMPEVLQDAARWCDERCAGGCSCAAVRDRLRALMPEKRETPEP